jgi:tetratricopeptide (TPR) repeat protein
MRATSVIGAASDGRHAGVLDQGPGGFIRRGLIPAGMHRGPYPIADRESPIRLAEAAVRGATESQKRNYLNTLGAALYRAGRYDEAIRRLEEAIQARPGGQGIPADWSLLAMAHHRLGHREFARRWLERLADYQPGDGSVWFAYDLDNRLLQS